MGVISALGNSLEENHDALLRGACALSSLELFETRYAERLKFGEIKIETARLKSILRANEADVTRTSLLALHAFNEAVAQSACTPEELSAGDTALITASTVGGMCLTDELYHDANSASDGSPFTSSYDCASVAMYLQRRYGIGGIVNTINTACSSSANAIMYGARLIRNGLAKRAIVGGVDSLAKYTINGFNSLNILAPQACRPFDRERNGLNLGEGAAFLVLEREEDCANKHKYAELSGYANANDAFHPSSLSENGEGPYRAMLGALTVAALTPDKIGYVNAHGTGTENNDEVESRALIRIFGQCPPFTSAKSKIGHTLGAAAAIESVFSILALYHGEYYPSLGFSTPIESTGLTPVTEYRRQPLTRVMTNSFGFGGNCSALIYSKV